MLPTLAARRLYRFLAPEVPTPVEALAPYTALLRHLCSSSRSYRIMRRIVGNLGSLRYQPAAVSLAPACCVERSTLSRRHHHRTCTYRPFRMCAVYVDSAEPSVSDVPYLGRRLSLAQRSQPPQMVCKVLLRLYFRLITSVQLHLLNRQQRL